MNLHAFGDMRLCSLANSYRRPNSYHCPTNGGCRPSETSIPTAMKMEVERSSETPLTIYHSTWWRITEDLHQQQNHCLCDVWKMYVVNSVKSVLVCWHALIIRCPSSRISGGTFSSSSSMLNSPCSFNYVDADKKTMYREHSNITLRVLRCGIPVVC